MQASYGVTNRYFRSPGGNFAAGGSTTLRQVCQLNGVYPLGWAIDSLDWQTPGVQQIVDKVVKAATPGAVVLMHDAGGSNRDQTLAALPTIIGTLKAAGYEFRRCHPTVPSEAARRPDLSAVPRRAQVCTLAAIRAQRASAELADVIGVHATHCVGRTETRGQQRQP